MTTYTCKCGKTFDKNISAATTGNRMPNYGPKHECFGCPFIRMVSVRDPFNNTDSEIAECRGCKERLFYATEASCVDSKASTLHVKSLDFDFIQSMTDFYNTLDGVDEMQHPPHPGMDEAHGKLPFSFSFPQNLKGEAAKQKLIEQFFKPVNTGNSYSKEYFRKDVSGCGEQYSLYRKIRDAIEEAKSMIQTEPAVETFTATKYRHGGRILHVGPSEEKFRTFFYFLEDPSEEIFLGALPKCDTPEIAQKMLDDYAARHDYEVYEPTSEAETPLASDLSSDDTPAETADEPENDEPVPQQEQDEGAKSQNDTSDSENDEVDPCDWKNASGSDEEEEEKNPEPDIPAGQSVSLRDSVFDEIIDACDAKINSALRVMLESHERKFDFTAKVSFEQQGDRLTVTHETGYKFEPINYKNKATLYEDIQIVLGADGNPIIPYDREHQMCFDEIQPGRVIPPTPVTTTVDGNTGLVEDVQVEVEPPTSDDITNDAARDDLEPSMLPPCNHEDCPFHSACCDDDSTGCCFDTENPDDSNFAGDVWTAINMESCRRPEVLEAYRLNNPEDDYDGSDEPDETDDLPFDMQENYEEDSEDED